MKSNRNQPIAECYCVLYCKDNMWCITLYVTERYWQLRASTKPDCCGCLLLKWMQNWFHASTQCSSPWTDRWWHWLWFVLKEITLISAALSPNGQCRCVCVHVSVQVYLHTCVCTDGCMSASVSEFVSLETNLSKAWKSWVYCCIQSTSLPEVSMATEKVKVRLEVSREFRRDREKDSVLPHKDSFHQLNMTERISEWLQSSVLHEQSVISKHSAHNLRALRHTPQWHSLFKQYTLHFRLYCYIKLRNGQKNHNRSYKKVVLLLQSSKVFCHGYKSAKELSSAKTLTTIMCCSRHQKRQKSFFHCGKVHFEVSECCSCLEAYQVNLVHQSNLQFTIWTWNKVIVNIMVYDLINL